MRYFKVGLLAILMLSAGVGQAMDGVFDRSDDVKRFQEALKTPDRRAQLLTARDIYNSGIADPELAAVVNTYLLDGFAATSGLDTKYAAWMIRALSSFGLDEYADSIKKIAKSTNVKKLRAECDENVNKIAWHKIKNAIMASRENYIEGDNPRAAMVLNLLKAEDPSYKRYAVSLIGREEVFSVRLLDEMATQVGIFAAQKNVTKENEYLAKHYLRWLSMSVDPKHRAVVEKVAQAKNPASLSFYAKKVLSKVSKIDDADEGDSEPKSES